MPTEDAKGNVLADSAMDYLRRKGLAGGATDILRDAAPPVSKLDAERKG